MEDKFSKNFETDVDQCLWIGSKPEDLVIQKPLFRLKQFKALIKKRFIHTIRNKSLSLAQILIPVSFLAVLEPEQSPALKIKLSDYDHNYAPYSIKGIQTNGILSKLSIVYKNLLITSQNTQTFELTETNKINMCKSDRDSVENYLNCLGRNSFRMLNKQHFIATEFSYFRDKIQITGSFNNQPYHVAPLSLNLITNSLFKYFTNSSQNSITVINNPLPKNPSEILNESSFKSLNNFRIGTALNFGLSFLVASFSMFLIKEKTCGSKHLQFLSGCCPFMFWLSTFIWDFLNYIIPVFFVVLLFMIFNVIQIAGEDRIFYLVSLLILYGLAHIPQTYLFSLLFKVSSSGFSFITAWNIFTSQIGLIIIQILTIPNLGTSQIAGHLEIVFMILFPNFAMGQAIIDLYDNYENLKLCQDASYGCRYEPNPCCRYVKQLKRKKACGDFDCLYWNNDYWSWEKPGLSRYAVSLLFHSFFSRKKNLAFKLNSKEIQNSEVDSDVINNFMVSSLTKYYLNLRAVNQISFGVKFKECFGLLGVNGAGKTSTFKMITGQEDISNGEVFIDKINLASHRNKFQKRLGYCPQIDPLIDQMTVFETIMLFVSLRGIRNELEFSTTLSLINLFDLNEHKNKMCYTLSGGNKRKLSVALALVGSPNVILLDEPTSGMDPRTRRILWNCINKIRIRGKSLILTTHSMEEAEALCTKIAIMVNGEFKCLGSLQHLKNKYGDGFTLLLVT
ncbi:ATP-binding cassette sub-family A member 3-like [Brachionus plicatilis]|uniref:ATP-binding cassette sub-family A member 3-like n=1 Tax=Brachionus plicatilis TaxID=10195 RepID=A0A3M7RQ79_BRAPC|nr:ATP-binding cassette sub-family A member 3-like [Brachionus plicatilis]